MRKTRKTDYLILALLCLVLLNVGSMLIRTRDDIRFPHILDEMQVGVVKNFGGYLKAKWEEMNYLERALDVFKKEDLSEENYPEELEPEGEETREKIDHYKSEDEIIIERLEEYESLIIIRDSKGSHGVENIPKPIGIDRFNANREKPYVLIYHTHATEAYNGNKLADYRSSKKEENVLGIGEIMTKVLQAKGHRVDHDMTYHDLPSYNKSYSRSLNTINKKREESENLKVFLDIHRDAVDLERVANIEALKEKNQIEINGKTYAKFSLVVGPDSENKEYTLAFAKYIKAVSDTIYPGLCSGIIIKPYGKYNQHLSNYSTLIEMGYNFHDYEMITDSSKLVAEVLSYALDGLIEE